MALFFPLSGDDWNRMAQLDRSLSWFLYAIDDQWHHLNGRVVGNLISYLFIKPAPVRALIKAASWLALVKLITRISHAGQPLWIWLTSALLTLIPIEVFRQVWVWSAGFYNYVPPMVFFFIYFWKEMQILQKRDRPGPGLILWFLFAVQAGLYMENLTVLFVLFTGFFVIYHWVRKGRLSWTSLVLFLGATIGCWIMFSSPVYSRVMAGEDDYRSVGASLVEVMETVKGNWSQFSRFMLRANPLQVVFLISLIGLLLVQKIAFRSNRYKLAYLALLLVSLILMLTPYLAREEVTTQSFLLDLGLHLAFYLLILGMGFALISDGDQRRNWVISIGALPFGMGSLLFVTPVLARNFIMPAFLHVFLIILLVGEASREGVFISDWAMIKKVLATFTTAVYVTYMVIYVANGLSFFERNRIMQEAVDLSLDHTTIRRYPFEWAVATDDPGKIGKYYYKEEPYDIEVTYEEDWKEIH